MHSCAFQQSIATADAKSVEGNRIGSQLSQNRNQKFYEWRRSRIYICVFSLNKSCVFALITQTILTRNRQVTTTDNFNGQIIVLVYCNYFSVLSVVAQILVSS